MRITVLIVPDCPNAPVVRQRIDAALAGRVVDVETLTVADEAEAVSSGMTGSPTILIDGSDPFRQGGAVPSLSCRVYRHYDGHMDGAPSVDELRRALAAAGLPEPEGGDCREDDLLGAVGRGGRGRLAPAARGLRAVQQAVLRHFAATGRAPEVTELEPAAAAAGRRAHDVLAELAAEDFLALDSEGRITAAYPFSSVATPHRVVINGGAQVWAMCAIDALGIPAMLGTDVAIQSSDPVTGEAITVTVTVTTNITSGGCGTVQAQPPATVVFLGRRSCAGPAATVCCDALNFFTSPVSARTWIAQHPDVRGEIVDLAHAERVGREIFGPLFTVS